MSNGRYSESERTDEEKFNVINWQEILTAFEATQVNPCKLISQAIFTLCGNKYVAPDMNIFNKRLTAILKDYLKISFEHLLWHAFFH